MTGRADLEMATEQVIAICRNTSTPNEAFGVLAVAIQVLACMSEAGRDQALARVTEILQTARQELAAHYDTYIVGLRAAEERMKRWEKVHQKLEETLTVWIEGEPFEPPPHKAGDKTRH